jgi:hypothetical protein
LGWTAFLCHAAGIAQAGSPDQDFRKFLASSRETLAIEIKQWIDPSTAEGTAKIAKACIALRNLLQAVQSPSGGIGRWFARTRGLSACSTSAR